MSGRFPCRRPPAAARRFASAALEDAIGHVGGAIADPELAWLFANCLPNTLDTTVTTSGDGRDTYVVTGDIDAMWLRDSTAQLWPYLPFVAEDRRLALLVEGAVRRQAACIRLDPYANAFYDAPRSGEWADDRTEMRPGVHERKWELDSVAAFLRLSHGYWRASGSVAAFDDDWVGAVAQALALLRVEEAGDASPYTFRRACDWGDSLPNQGRGDPWRRCGLVRSAFRPSDDQCKLPLLTPANAMLAVTLEDITAPLDALARVDLAADARAIADGVRAGLDAHGVVEHPTHGPIWAYEVDGFGGRHLMDDANAPSLLSLAYLGFHRPGDERYRATRAFCLSDDNSYFVRGRTADGIGSPHTGRGTIWPMSIVMRALTATDDAEVALCLRQLRATHAGTGFMHESFDPADPARFTRPWFAWANSLFGELILTLHRERPHLLATPL
ncbi:glycoside hydrolase family 125 protein [Sphingomonas lenta]|uniref:glycoside hydrolase family 125 protein n=1 Tax=Sphingomonas lenta TaxID=1141887 RepID=UPI001C3EF3C2|nr:glycoside hydrolase family 125 protein [Sphingomonas lenta]